MKTIRLIELFAGYGSQLMALKRLAKEKNLKIESYRVSEWETGAIKSYTSVHHHGEDFDIDNLSFDKVMDCLEKLIISYNGKVPMTRDEMKRRGEEWCREILRDMIVSKNLGSITRITGDKLGIVDKDKYTYMMTYSFPCTNLSLLGKQEGMDKDSGTGSSLLWEVDRILHECKELPQILLMENVTQVHSKKNKDNWLEWCRKLEELGYQNFVADLNAKDYGVPQNRKRCYMVSILKDSDIDCNFEFPKEMELTESIKDRLQSNPNEFVKFDMDRLRRISKWKSYQNPLDRVKGYEDIIPTITTRVMISDGGGINASTILMSRKLAKSCNLRQEVLDGKDLSYLELRGLTTRECGRFMGVSDDDIDKMKEVCNYKELYKQFGNSIVVDVLYYIFKNLF